MSASASAPASQAAAPSGLTEAEAAARLVAEGPNTYPDRDQHGVVWIILEVIREPMFALLIVGGLVYMTIGDRSEALLLLGFALLSVIIAVVQAFRSERVLAALRELAAPVATVVRDGVRRQLPSHELVRGDLLAFAEGQRMPADIVLRQGDDIEADESLLTGESTPVAKHPAAGVVAPARPGGEDTPLLYSGSLVVRGQGFGEVVATGRRTELGRLGQSLESIVEPPGGLTLEFRRIVGFMGMAALAVCATTVLFTGLAHGAWLQAVLAGVALGMALLPEEFPLVLTVFTVMGAWRLSQVGVLTRRATAIETLGAATVLCTDKTGTLTENRMRLVAAWLGGKLIEWPADGPPPASVRPIAHVGRLASAEHPFDPMERAFHEACEGWSAAQDGLASLRLYGLTPQLMAVSQVWDGPGAGDRLVAAKGAPEAILRLCQLGGDAADEVLAAVEDMAQRGLRVLAVAQAPVAVDWTPDDNTPLDFIGLAGLADPLRADAAAAVAECRAAGVRVVMITGDYPATAAEIARQAGLSDGAVLTGAELAALGDEDLARQIGDVGVFARILPEQKLRIVQALQARGEVVAMTGDGVNDAPALKAADIGIAMGSRGADVARAAADLVLLRDDFTAIVAAMRLGRRIYDNLNKASGFILAVHVPIAGLALAPLLAGFPPFLLPAHIAFIEMIIDPACSIVFEVEPAEPGVMRRPPRAPGAPLFTAARVVRHLAQGLIGLAGALGAYFAAGALDLRGDAVRTTAFLALILVVLGLVIANRSLRSAAAGLARPTPALVAVAATAAVALSGVLLVAPLRALFHFAAVGPLVIGVALAGGGAAFAALQVLAVVLPEPEPSRGAR